jgi:hypothetical protein
MAAATLDAESRFVEVIHDLKGELHRVLLIEDRFFIFPLFCHDVHLHRNNLLRLLPCKIRIPTKIKGIKIQIVRIVRLAVPKIDAWTK